MRLQALTAVLAATAATAYIMVHVETTCEVAVTNVCDSRWGTFIGDDGKRVAIDARGGCHWNGETYVHPKSSPGKEILKPVWLCVDWDNHRGHVRLIDWYGDGARGEDYWQTRCLVKVIDHTTYGSVDHMKFHAEFNETKCTWEVGGE